MSYHTPGPWDEMSTFGSIRIIAGAEGQHDVADLLPGDPTLLYSDQINSNAHLISAAPDLLEAAETLLFELTAGPSDIDTATKVVAAARAAINKARGTNFLKEAP